MSQKWRRAVAGAALLGGLLAGAAAPDAAAQAEPTKPAGWEIAPRAGVVRHQLAGHTAQHATVGVAVVPFRSGATRLLLEVDGWRDGIDLGAVFGSRTVDANYLLYGVSVRTGREDLYATAGAGGETALFGERYEAASLFPSTSTSPQASLGLGARVALGRATSAWSLGLEGRGYAVYAEAFDPTGIRRGRELFLRPALTLGVAYSAR